MAYIINFLFLCILALFIFLKMPVLIILTSILTIGVLIALLINYSLYYDARTSYDAQLMNISVNLFEKLKRIKPIMSEYIGKYNETYKNDFIGDINIENIKIISDTFPAILISPIGPTIREIMTMDEKRDNLLMEKAKLNSYRFWFFTKTIDENDIYREKTEISIPYTPQTICASESTLDDLVSESSLDDHI